VLVTENGAAYPDLTLDDQDRIAYLRDHIAATQRAREAGADIRAYIVWTLLDNFEWAEGYTKTFGIVHVDPREQTRTPKKSFDWLAEHISDSAGSAVTP
jgi:beta-glucosidase